MIGMIKAPPIFTSFIPPRVERESALLCLLSQFLDEEVPCGEVGLLCCFDEGEFLTSFCSLIEGTSMYGDLADEAFVVVSTWNMFKVFYVLWRSDFSTSGGARSVVISFLPLLGLLSVGSKCAFVAVTQFVSKIPVWFTVDLFVLLVVVDVAVVSGIREPDVWSSEYRT